MARNREKLRIIRPEELEEGCSDNLFGLEIQGPQARAGARRVSKVSVDGPENRGDLSNHQTEPLVPLAQRLFRLHELRDVVGHDLNTDELPVRVSYRLDDRPERHPPPRHVEGVLELVALSSFQYPVVPSEQLVGQLLRK